MNVRMQNVLSFAAGVAAGAALPVVAPAIAEASRPLAKALLKHGMIGLERARTQLARSSESLQDLMAEVRAEVDDALKPAVEVAQSAAAPAPTVSVPETPVAPSC
jgi:hypothetical protein